MLSCGGWLRSPGLWWRGGSPAAARRQGLWTAAASPPYRKRTPAAPTAAHRAPGLGTRRSGSRRRSSPLPHVGALPQRLGTGAFRLLLHALCKGLIVRMELRVESTVVGVVGVQGERDSLTRLEASTAAYWSETGRTGTNGPGPASQAITCTLAQTDACARMSPSLLAPSSPHAPSPLRNRQEASCSTKGSIEVQIGGRHEAHASVHRATKERMLQGHGCPVLRWQD
jgi:hypothetical protein